MLARAAVLSCGFTAVSRVLGFLRETVFAAYVSDGDEQRARASFNAIFTIVLTVPAVAAGVMALNLLASAARVAVPTPGALALIQAAYPALGSASRAEDRAALRELLRRSLATVALLLVPVAAAAIALREPVVELVYGRDRMPRRVAAARVGVRDRRRAQQAVRERERRVMALLHAVITAREALAPDEVPVRKLSSAR